MRKSRKRNSIFVLLLRNYIFFTFILVFLIISLFLLFTFRSFQKIEDYTTAQISDYKLLLENGNYKEFPATRLLGENSFIVILNDLNEQIYSNSNQNVEFNEDELYYIPKYGSIDAVVTTEFITAANDVNYQVTFSCYDDEKVEMKNTYIWNQNWNMLYSTNDFKSPTMNERIFNLLSNKLYGDYRISKYLFEDSQQNKPYTLLIFTDTFDYTIFSMIGKVASDSFILLAVIYGVMVLGFIIWLKRKITKPLYLLCTQLNQYEIGHSITNNYKGPREFCDIMDSYTNMAERLKQSENYRKSLEEDKQKMLADVAHDLKTPITVIQGYAEALRDGIIPKDRQPDYENIIAQKAKNLNELINTFYEFSKLEHPDYALNKEIVDICNYTRDYIADKYSEIENASFDISVNIPEMHIMCQLDILQFKRVFDNIISNSIKYNPKGTVLYFKVEQIENKICIILGDDGCGIPSELQAEIFKPFVMGDTSRKGDGSGIGLSVAKRIVEMHDGSICLLNEVNNMKAVFKIIIPIYLISK